jgi:hypothetical protein
MRTLVIEVAAAAAFASGPAMAQAAAAPQAAPAAEPAYSTSSTQLGTLMANPATKEVLLKHIPEMVNGLGDNLERASGMTLKEMQGALATYSPDALPDAKLAAIDADLAKIPASD